MKKLLSIFAALFATVFIARPVLAVAPNWDVTGTYVVNVEYLGTNYPETLILTQSGTDITGTSLDTIPAGSFFTVTGGSVIGDVINIYANNGSPYYHVHMVGTIAPDGSMVGTWADETPGTRTGTWSTTAGVAKAIVSQEVAMCPANTTEKLVETVTVPADSPEMTSSSNVLLGGMDYLIVSSGTWHNRDDISQAVDTEYATMNNWSTYMDGYNMGDYNLGEGEFDLQVNGGFVNWGEYNLLNTYSHLITGDGNTVKFRIFDGYSNVPNPIPEPGWYGDNSGSLKVDIYTCEPNKPALPTNKDQCKKDGWKSFGVFKNQGDCVSYVQSSPNAIGNKTK